MEGDVIFNERDEPIYVQHPVYSDIFFLKREEATDADYTDDDYYAYHDENGKLLDKEVQ